MQDYDGPENPEVEEQDAGDLYANVVNIAAAFANRVAASAGDDEEPDIDDLAWIAKRLVRKALDEINWYELAGGAAAICDESDVAVIRQLLTGVQFTVEIPGL